MNDKEKTVEQLIKEFRELLISGDQYGQPSTGSKLYEAANAFVRKKVYEGNAHAQLGEHVEAIMKHFKGLA